MARTPITAQPTGSSFYPTVPLVALSRDVPFVAANVADGNSAEIVNGKTLLLAMNTSPDTAYTVTIDSTPDAQGREGDITAYSIPFGKVVSFGPFKRAGWEQDSTDHLLHFQGSNAAVKFAVLQLP